MTETNASDIRGTLRHLFRQILALYATRVVYAITAFFVMSLVLLSTGIMVSQARQAIGDSREMASVWGALYAFVAVYGAHRLSERGFSLLFKRNPADATYVEVDAT